MIHGLQGAAKLVYNVGRDSTSSAYYEVSDDEVNEELSTSRCRHPNQVGIADKTCEMKSRRRQRHKFSFLRKGQLNRHTLFVKGSVESTHKVPTSHYHTKHCHAAVVSLGGLTHR